ncbi:hypothetical protein D9619_002563 [Psilocybe cf. subviscida]|uniref:Nephrocystin 3-like N-terminal domain-containing protein n=1 Tax=Psilocybe cf. subviscida TaxID=2480587 RepID=A0A8H5EU65_9AGAR|nr:hypothetical protein D9619_002563 [Psilocybe cf. subviscida]
MEDTFGQPSVIQAESVVVTGGEFSQTITINHIHNHAEHHFEKEIQGLLEFVSDDAFYDSLKHAYPHQYVLTPAEQEIISTATDWALKTNPVGGQRIFHLDISACAAGHFVAQHIAERFEEQKCLCGTFFFRFPEHAIHPERLIVTTLAYQLSANLPDTKPAILGAIRSDPCILTRSTQKQMERLIIEPLRRLSCESPETPDVFIISVAPESCSENILSSITQAVDAVVDKDGCVRFLVLEHDSGRGADFKFLDSPTLVWVAGNYWFFFFFVDSACPLSILDFGDAH